MTPQQVLAIQVPWSLLVYTLFVRWWIAPRLAALPIHRALMPVLAVHLIRPISLWTTVGDAMPGMRIPHDWAMSTAIGDLIAAGLAMTALLLLRRQARAGIALAWVANVVGLLDAIKNGVGAARLGFVNDVGPAGLIMAYAVPALFVTHAVIFWLLIRHARGRHAPASTLS
jgi:hypothetical protein